MSPQKSSFSKPSFEQISCGLEDGDELFFPKWSLKNNSSLVCRSRTRETLEIIHPPGDVEFASKYSWNELMEIYVVNAFQVHTQSS